MERLAKDKIAAQNRILLLKRELVQWDIDITKLLTEQIDVSAVKVERTGETSSIILFECQPFNLLMIFRTCQRCFREEWPPVQFHKLPF